MTSDIFELFHIFSEFLRATLKIRSVGPAVTVFGSARFKEDTPYYSLARQIGGALAKEGYTVVTGGGPGLMEAASRGAKDVGGKTIGCNIILPHEQRANAYADRVFTFGYFFIRKVILTKHSCAFVILPGGTGTLDEAFETILLIQTGKLPRYPVILVGKEYWKGLFDWMEKTLIKNGAVTASELAFVHQVDSPEDVIRIISRKIS